MEREKLLDLLETNLILTQEEVFNKMLKLGKRDLVGYHRGAYMMFKRGEGVKPLLCVHLDTINDAMDLTPSPADFKYTKKTNKVSLAYTSRLNCVGGDDRCGVTIIEALYKQLIVKYHIAFFCDEEVGGIGSTKASEIINDDDSISCYIGLDRKGINEVATYGYDNKELLKLFFKQGYVENYGTFTDASNLSSTGSLACVNISVGYGKEHTPNEFIDLAGIEKAMEALLCIKFKGVYKAHNMYKGAYQQYSSSKSVDSIYDDSFIDAVWNEASYSRGTLEDNHQLDQDTFDDDEETFLCDYCGMHKTKEFNTEWSVFICDKCKKQLDY